MLKPGWPPRQVRNTSAHLLCGRLRLYRYIYRYTDYRIHIRVMATDCGKNQPDYEDKRAIVAARRRVYEYSIRIRHSCASKRNKRNAMDGPAIARNCAASATVAFAILFDAIPRFATRTAATRRDAVASAAGATATVAGRSKKCRSRTAEKAIVRGYEYCGCGLLLCTAQHSSQLEHVHVYKGPYTIRVHL
ncbi:hypothetical protein V9T40_007491 [Parthenolecanium corni]|uniref:Uncharacterized protein n=1 Tax=Parthenolecanium corni TaxID=536013 RepID=A0AAN9TXS1_9HEMI